jgi:hypothetical protein
MMLAFICANIVEASSAVYFRYAEGYIPLVSKIYILSKIDWGKVSCLQLTPRDTFQNISKHPLISDQSLKS